MQRRQALVGLAVLLAASVLWGVWLLGASMQAVADNTRAECGSAITVVRNGTAYVGGEMHGDQEAFDRRCRGLAHEHFRLAMVAGGVAIIAVAALGALKLTDHARRTRPAPATYTFHR